MSHASKPWFAQKRFGYGAGWPTAWQGWAVLLVFLAAIAAACLLLKGLALALMVSALTIAVSAIAAAKTDGGWRWRWGSDAER